jgi:tetratricopeptide (TPR) repeat protein
MKMSAQNINTKGSLIALILGCVLPHSACSTAKQVFADQRGAGRGTGPITNPFIDYQFSDKRDENIILRTKKGDRAVEIELPSKQGELADFVIPVSPTFMDQNRGPASLGGSSSIDPETDQTFKSKRPSITDREIVANMPSATPGLEGEQRDIETGLGVVPSDEEIPAADTSYLAAIDHIKQLYKYGRNEAALLEIDEMLRAYPTDPKLYQMRGTLLDRVGRDDLALKSWNQALRLDPNNQPLRKFIERKQTTRNIASQ